MKLLESQLPVVPLTPAFQEENSSVSLPARSSLTTPEEIIRGDLRLTVFRIGTLLYSLEIERGAAHFVLDNLSPELAEALDVSLRESTQSRSPQEILSTIASIFERFARQHGEAGYRVEVIPQAKVSVFQNRGLIETVREIPLPLERVLAGMSCVETELRTPERNHIRRTVLISPDKRNYASVWLSNGGFSLTYLVKGTSPQPLDLLYEDFDRRATHELMDNFEPANGAVCSCQHSPDFLAVDWPGHIPGAAADRLLHLIDDATRVDNLTRGHTLRPVHGLWERTTLDIEGAGYRHLTLSESGNSASVITVFRERPEYPPSRALLYYAGWTENPLRALRDRLFLGKKAREIVAAFATSSKALRQRALSNLVSLPQTHFDDFEAFRRVVE